jgi:hypothetical protein
LVAASLLVLPPIALGADKLREDQMAPLKRAALAVLVIVLFFPFSAFAASLPKAGCRPVSKLEYTNSKKENVIISQGGRFVRTGPFWRRNYWHCPV